MSGQQKDAKVHWLMSACIYGQGTIYIYAARIINEQKSSDHSETS